MPHNAQTYIVKNIFQRPQASRHLNHIEASDIEQILLEDADNYFYSSTISMASAYSSIEYGQFSWATVQLYYSTFYILRGLLAVRKICIAYEARKAMSLLAQPLAVPQNAPRAVGGSTHGFAIHLAKTNLSTLVSAGQQIDGLEPLEWMKERREEANYKHARFPEPEAPRHLQLAQKLGVRRLLAAYLTDTEMTYTFDVDHAMIAYNLHLWKALKQELDDLNRLDFQDHELAYLRSLFFDSNGPIGSIQSFL
jgi:hypothetical protein